MVEASQAESNTAGGLTEALGGGESVRLSKNDLLWLKEHWTQTEEMQRIERP